MARASSNKRNTVQINIIGDDTELSDSLQDSEEVINSFGKRITSSFAKAGTVVSDLKDTFVSMFTKSAEALARFTLNIKDSTNALDTFGSTWERARMFLEAFGLEIKEVILQNRSLAKTNELVEQSSGFATESLQQYAEHLERTTRFSSDATKSAMQLIMHFRNIHGEQFIAATKSAQDLATELRTDLNSAAQLVGESLNDPITAIERLTAVNVFFTDKEKQLIKTAMEANKVVEAQDLILNKLIKSFGGAAKEAGDTFYGKLDRLQNLMHTIGTKVGESVYNKINRILETLYDGRKVFDVIIEKISQWGNVAIAVSDAVLDKIANFVIASRTQITEVFNWLIDKTLTVAFTIPQAFQRTANILSSLNTFLFISFTKVWNGISNIFTTILPASYKYMKDIFNNVITSITRNGYVFWLNFKEFAQTALHNIWVEFLKLKTKISGWFQVISQIYTLWKDGMLSDKGLSAVLEAAITGNKSKIDVLKNSNWFDPRELYSLNKIGNLVEEIEGKINKQTGSLDSYKQEWKDLNSLLNNLNIENPFPDFNAGLNTSVDLTKEWATLLSNVSGVLDKDFDNVDDKVANVKKYFEDFMKEVKEKSEALAEPGLEVEKQRRADEQKKKDFSSKMVSGLEEFWYKGESAQDKNTKAVQENTKELKKNKSLEDTRKDKRTVNEERMENLRKQQRDDRLKYLEEQGRLKKTEKQLSLDEISRKEKEAARQKKLYGISEDDVKHLEELKKKEKQARARGAVLSSAEYKEMQDLEAKKRSRDMHLRNINNEELRQTQRNELRQRALANRTNQERLAGIRNPNPHNFSSSNTTTEKNTQLEKASKENMKSAMRDANKESVSELSQINKNTERMAKFFSSLETA